MVYYRSTEYRGNFPKIYAIVKDELFTKKEVEKYKIPAKILVPVEISKKRVYFFFGARFEGLTWYYTQENFKSTVTPS